MVPVSDVQVFTRALFKNTATHKHEARQAGEYQQQIPQPILGRPRGVLVGWGIQSMGGCGSKAQSGGGYKQLKRQPPSCCCDKRVSWLGAQHQIARIPRRTGRKFVSKNYYIAARRAWVGRGPMSPPLSGVFCARGGGAHAAASLGWLASDGAASSGLTASPTHG